MSWCRLSVQTRIFSPRRFLGAYGLIWGTKRPFSPTILSCWLRPSEQKRQMGRDRKEPTVINTILLLQTPAWRPEVKLRYFPSMCDTQWTVMERGGRVCFHPPHQCLPCLSPYLGLPCRPSWKRGYSFPRAGKDSVHTRIFCTVSDKGPSCIYRLSHFLSLEQSPCQGPRLGQCVPDHIASASLASVYPQLASHQRDLDGSQ